MDSYFKQNCLSFLMIAASLVASAADNAAVHTHVVSADADSGAASLREALAESARTPGPDKITFGNADGFFNTPRTITLDSPLPPIDGAVRIDGHIPDLLWRTYGVTISGDGNHRLFQVPAGSSLEIAGITLAHGIARNGAAVVNHGRLIAEGVTFLGNHATEAGGAIANFSGEVLIINSTATDNHALRGGAVANLKGGLRVTHATLYRNGAPEGAALYNDGPLIIANSILAGEGKQCINAGHLKPVTTHNLITSHDGCGKPLLDQDPKLGQFGRYNGPTPVFVIQGGSPVLNLASQAAAVGPDGNPLVWDQRGNGDPRFAGGYADLGSFERQGPIPAYFLVDTIEDTGLRGCTVTGAADCPLRAALQLSAAARQPIPIRFDPRLFSGPRTIRLESIPSGSDIPLLIDGDGTPITIVVPNLDLPWDCLNGVRLERSDRQSEADPR